MAYRWKSAAAARLTAAAGVKKNDVEMAVEKIVAELLSDLPAGPTQLELLFPKLNVSGVVFDSDMLAQGELHPASGKFQIRLNPAQTKQRQRFTIAHELGHVIIESTGSHAPKSGLELERICDLLAAEILMPRRMVRDTLGTSPRLRNVFEAAEAFDVSMRAMLVRYAREYRRSVFAVEGEEIVWSVGEIKPNSALCYSFEFSSFLKASQKSVHGSARIPLPEAHSIRMWNIEWYARSRHRYFSAIR